MTRRSKLLGPRSSPSNDAGALSGLSGPELRGIARLWRRSNREIKAKFDGTSMQPTIAPGTELLVHCTDQVARDDVILYVYMDQVVVHRLIAIRRGWLLTRGDAHVIPDPPITDRDIIMGRVEKVWSGSSYDVVPRAPCSIARVLALWFVSLAGLGGARGVNVAIHVLRVMRGAIGRRDSAW